MVHFTLVAALAASLSSVALADFKLVQVDSYPAWGGSYGGTTATQFVTATPGGGTPSCAASVGSGFDCDGCGFVSGNDGYESDAELGMTNPFYIKGDGGGDFCLIPSMTCTLDDTGAYICVRDDDQTTQATCTINETAFDGYQCDDINGTSSVSAFMDCVGLACG